jgi:tRNA threonylcarbamoyladenosine modification (KEOPS) complex  Pcc1 subunit
VHKCRIELECRDPEHIADALKKDVEQTKKFGVTISTKPNVVILEFSSHELSGLLAGVNSYVKLAKLALEVSKDA